MMTKMDIAKYTLLPGILPRFLAFFRTGFAHVAYLLAIIYGAVRLLPADHPYLMPRNFGQFGLRHVIAAAANNLVFERQYIDRIFVFVVLLAGIFMLFAQIALFIFSLTFLHPAVASALDPAVMLGTPVDGYDQDIAAILLDRVFGVSGAGAAGSSFFESCISATVGACTNMNGVDTTTGLGAFPWPFHTALHQLFKFYSYGIFAVGALVIIYFIITVVAETAQSGTPFGQRFNKTWAPVRIILFFALLIPLSQGTTGTVREGDGLNGAQMILLKVVKLGSNFATNGWIYFNDQVTTGGGSQHYLSQQKELIATPNVNVPEIQALLQFVAVAHTCREAYNAYAGVKRPIDAYVVRPTIPAGGGYGTIVAGEDAATNNAKLFSTLPNYADATDFTKLGDISIRFGELAPVTGGVADPRYSKFLGQVMPYCGELTIKVTDQSRLGAIKIHEEYYQIIRDMWADPMFLNHAQCIVKKATGASVSGAALNCVENFSDDDLKPLLENYTLKFTDAIEAGLNEERTSGFFDLSPEVKKRGWAGASLWYNQISEMNGAITSASFNIPQPSKLPFLMEKTFKQQQAVSSNVVEGNMFSTEIMDQLGARVKVEFAENNSEEILKSMKMTNNIWSNSKVATGGGLSDSTGNVMLDFINLVFGTYGIFEMRKNTDVHPLGQLSALGRGMMDAVVRNAAIATSIKFGDSLLKITSKFQGKAAIDSAQGFFFSMVATTMGMAIILYYVLPIMPFLYFLFAVSGWLKSIFEAMVAMPLWALGHLRIDGEGVMGPGAMNGYFLLLEVFLRPILILFGMVVSIATFSAFIGVLNIIFDQVISNVGGFDRELESKIADGSVTGIAQLSSAVGSVDQFFYTAMYTVICYMMAVASFKQIDAIPNQILRWMGVQVQTFQENAGDPVGKLGSQVQRGGILVTNQLRGRNSGLAELG